MTRDFKDQSERLKISVIVPVYNGEKYIRRCIDSVLVQSVREIEILLLDDGSKDGSLGILREYEAKYPELIRVHTHPNMGVAETRNKGIRIAKGEYIAFLDQDDYFDDDYLKTFYDAAEAGDADVVIGGYRRADGDGKARFTVRPTSEEYIKTKNLQVWSKLHRTKFLRENELYLFSNSIGEDIPLSIRENALAKNTVIIDYVGYNWFYNEESVTYTLQQGLDRNIEGIRALLEEIHKGWTESALFEYVVIKTVIYLLLACGRADRSEVFMKYYRELFVWLGQNYPNFGKNRYALMGPRGQEKLITFQVSVFLHLHKLHLVGAFAKVFCRGSR